MKREQILHGRTYHIFNRGNNGEEIFIEQPNYSYFLLLMKRYLLPIANIYAYCLLKNHFHILLRIKEQDAITNVKLAGKPSLAFSHLFNAYAKAINKRYNRYGSLFQEHFKRILVEDEKYLTQLITYIHLNPVKHGFAASIEYPYSSYKSIISDLPTNIDRAKVVDLFESKTNFSYWHSLKQSDYSTIRELIAEDV